MSSQFLLTALVTHEDKHTDEAVVAWFQRAVSAYWKGGDDTESPLTVPAFSPGIVRIDHAGGSGPPLDFHISVYTNGIAVSAKSGIVDLGEGLVDYFDNKLSVKRNSVPGPGSEPEGNGSYCLVEDVREFVESIGEQEESAKVDADVAAAASGVSLSLTDAQFARISAIHDELEALDAKLRGVGGDAVLELLRILMVAGEPG